MATVFLPTIKTYFTVLSPIKNTMICSLCCSKIEEHTKHRNLSQKIWKLNYSLVLSSVTASKVEKSAKRFPSPSFLLLFWLERIQDRAAKFYIKCFIKHKIGSEQLNLNKYVEIYIFCDIFYFCPELAELNIMFHNVFIKDLCQFSF